MQGAAYKMCTAIKPSISALNQTLSYENKGSDYQLKNLLIVKQILPASTLGNV